eukprot:2374990-Lingulodinium_polyedra.AAC.1
MPRERILLSTMPALPGPQIPARDPPWDHGWGPHGGGGLPPMMRSRARWAGPDGEGMPVGPAWQYAARRLLF